MATCPRCSAELAPDAPQGLCPACLLAQGVDPTTGPAAFETPDKTMPDESSVTVEQLAIAFPQLDQFQLIGRGGMGIVFKARQKQLDRFVALKLLSSRIVQSAAFTERFGREARALARLNHPNIVAVYDFGHVPTPGNPGQPLYYLIMEYVDGASLRTLIKTFSPAQALAIVPQVCEALQYAHDLEVIHRDIKPENILLDRKGRVKIADFGLAKLGQAVRSDLDHTLTQPDMVMGTPHYMAPEQLEKPAAVDHRADLYSLGVVFYELLTGELPIGRFQPPSAKVQVDMRLDEVVLKSLEKEPQRRYQHASELKTQVETISGHGAPALIAGAATAGLGSSDPSALTTSGATRHYSLPPGTAPIAAGTRESWPFYLRTFLLYSIAWIASFAFWNLGWTGFLLTVLLFSVISWWLVRRLLLYRPEIIAARRVEGGWKNRYRTYVAPLFFPAAFAILLMAVAVSGDGEGNANVASIFEITPSVEHNQDFLKSYQSDHPAELPADIRDLTLKTDFGLYPVAWSLNMEKLPALPSMLLVPMKPTTGQLTWLVSRVLLCPSAIPPEFRKLSYFSLYGLLGLFFVFACAADMLSSKVHRFSSISLWPPVLLVSTLFASYMAVLLAHGLFASFVQSSRLDSGGSLMVSEGRYMSLTKPGDASDRLLPALDRWAIEHGYEIAALTQGKLQDSHRYPVVSTDVTYQAAVLWKPGLFDRLHMDWQGIYSRAPEILVESASSKTGSRISITLPVFPTIKAENEAGNALQKDLHETLTRELP